MVGEVLQEKLDRLIVDQTIANIQLFASQEGDARQDEQFTAAYGELSDLFAEHASGLDEMTRAFFASLGATAINFAINRYGPDEMHPKQYSGRLEESVLATYHHAGHHMGMTRNMFRYATMRNHRYPGTFSRYNFGRFVIIGPFHDAIIGNGRGNDERQSGMLAADILSDVSSHVAGATIPADEEVIYAIEATTWDPYGRRQALNPDKGHFPTQQAACVADLLPLFEPHGPYEAVCLAPEAFCTYANGRIFTREAAAAGVSLVGASVDDCMHLIDERPALQEYLREFLISQVRFFKEFVPADPELDSYFPGRPQNTALMGSLVKDYKPWRHPSLTAHGVLLRAREYMLEAAA